MNIYIGKKPQIYIGCNQARESPLEPDVYLIPANATTTSLPDNVINI